MIRSSRLEFVPKIGHGTRRYGKRKRCILCGLLDSHQKTCPVSALTRTDGHSTARDGEFKAELERALDKI